MRAHFLLGPAGSGKTFRCVAEVRAELLRAPDGPPLVFLAPKQATFQIEREILSTGELAGYTRLHILSFERLSGFVFEHLGLPQPDLLSEEGRVMVLSALLSRHHDELRIYRASARLAGFARQLSLLLREFQRSRVSAGILAGLSGRVSGGGRLNDKLHDLSLLLGRYHEWLDERRASGHPLDDGNRLPDLATGALQEAADAGRTLEIGGLWLDGFAEMTPQEVALLAALAPHCTKATLAFCLDREPHGEISWLSPWTVIGRTFARCREALAKSTHSEPQVEILPRDPERSRFSSAPMIAELEQALAVGGAGEGRGQRGGPDQISGRSGGRLEANPKTSAVCLMACPDAEAEVVLAAREILRHVQGGGRFRDCAILVRSLDGYHDVLRRVLDRYEIPFFLDRRDAIAHHPLAELTRYALRTVAFDWRLEDWFGALKTGLAGVTDDDVDWLENEALKHGWEGRAWRESGNIEDPAPNTQHPNAGRASSSRTAEHEEGAQRLERVLQNVMPPFLTLAGDLTGPPPAKETGRMSVPLDGRLLATTILSLWRRLDVEGQLGAWAERAAMLGLNGAEHATVWAQMNEWLSNLELAFSGVTLPLREWLPILESGLAGMTAGVIPPTLDQVLVGSVDRSRNPDLQMVFVLGVNEGVFPAPPAPGLLLTESDRSEIEARGITLGPGLRPQLGHERYLGYIAFTRARQRLMVTWASMDSDGQEMNPSSFVPLIRRALPSVEPAFMMAHGWAGAVHRSELPEHILADRRIGREATTAGDAGIETPDARHDGIEALASLDELAPVVRRWQQVQDAAKNAALNPDIASRLYGNELFSSVSALEDFSACPFHFLAARGLRAQEREEFVMDAREKGSFQHGILEAFHKRVRGSGRQWRDIGPEEAKQMVREIGAGHLKTYRGGLLNANSMTRFTASVMIGNLERLIETLAHWARHYNFDPTEAEVSFGLPEARLPAWHIQLDGGRVLKLRGRIDRVDLYRTGAGEGEALAVICDYKSGGKEMKPVKIREGLELQLLSYLAALTRMPEAGVLFGVNRLMPAGVFYVPLRQKPASGKTRPKANALKVGPSSAYQHRGRFDGALLAQFDTLGLQKGEQFRFRINKDGSFSKQGNDAMQAGEFPVLVEQAENKLRAIGDAIYRGEAGVLPYCLKAETACGLCAYRAVCRFDPWTMPYRRLKEG